MKASDLIAEIAAGIAIHGDVPVCVNTGEYNERIEATSIDIVDLPVRDKSKPRRLFGPTVKAIFIS